MEATALRSETIFPNSKVNVSLFPCNVSMYCHWCSYVNCVLDLFMSQIFFEKIMCQTLQGTTFLFRAKKCSRVFSFWGSRGVISFPQWWHQQQEIANRCVALIFRSKCIIMSFTWVTVRNETCQIIHYYALWGYSFSCFSVQILIRIHLSTLHTFTDSHFPFGTEVYIGTPTLIIDIFS